MSLLAMLAVVMLVGCEGWRGLLPPTVPAPVAIRGEDLLAGVGWSDAADPAEAARQALATAIKPLGRYSPDLVLVWDNWNDAQEANAALAAMSRQVPANTIYGGHAAWPVAPRWSSKPAVAVLALAGWSVQAAYYEGVPGNERDAAASLAKTLTQAHPATVRGRDTPPAGAIVLIFGDLPGERAERLVRELARRVDQRLPIFGGGGSSPGGSGWQYVAGRLVHDSVWAIRLAGPFRASVLRSTPDANQAAIERAATAGLSILTADTAHTYEASPLLLISPTAGWLTSLTDPQRLATGLLDRLGATGLLAGWAGDSQIGPDAMDQSLSAGRFDMAMALIVPATARPASPPPIRPIQPVPASQPASTTATTSDHELD